MEVPHYNPDLKVGTKVRMIKKGFIWTYDTGVITGVITEPLPWCGQNYPYTVKSDRLYKYPYGSGNGDNNVLSFEANGNWMEIIK